MDVLEARALGRESMMTPETCAGCAGSLIMRIPASSMMSACSSEMTVDVRTELVSRVVGVRRLMLLSTLQAKTGALSPAHSYC